MPGRIPGWCSAHGAQALLTSNAVRHGEKGLQGSVLQKWSHPRLPSFDDFDGGHHHGIQQRNVVIKTDGSLFTK